jgi:hypothetical protein
LHRHSWSNSLAVRHGQAPFRRLRWRQDTDALFQALNAFLGFAKPIVDNERLPIWRRFADSLQDLPRRTVLLDCLLRLGFALQLFGVLKILVGVEKKVRGIFGKCRT